MVHPMRIENSIIEFYLSRMVSIIIIIILNTMNLIPQLIFLMGYHVQVI